IEAEEIFGRDLADWSGDINLRPLESANFLKHAGATKDTHNISLERIKKGIERREKSSILHDHIVDLVGKRLALRGFEVHEDRQSVDLLAKKDRSEYILEVKTVTPNSIIQRMRLGVGQLGE